MDGFSQVLGEDCLPFALLSAQLCCRSRYSGYNPHLSSSAATPGPSSWGTPSPRPSGAISLRGGQVWFEEGAITLTGKVKGGDYVGREVRDPLLREALLDYLSSSGRLVALKTDSPLWMRHDRAGRPGAALTSHAFVKNLKRYAHEAGVGEVHLHQTRHSFARVVAEETGSITDTQDALGRRNASTTRVYVQRIAVKHDKHSGRVTGRLKNPSSASFG